MPLGPTSLPTSYVVEGLEFTTIFLQVVTLQYGTFGDLDMDGGWLEGDGLARAAVAMEEAVIHVEVVVEGQTLGVRLAQVETGVERADTTLYVTMSDVRRAVNRWWSTYKDKIVV